MSTKLQKKYWKMFRVMFVMLMAMTWCSASFATGDDGIEKSYFSVLAGSPLVSNSSPLLVGSIATLAYPVENEQSKTIKNIITLSIFEETPNYIPGNFTASVRMLIEYGPSAASVSSITDTLEVTYNRNDGVKYNAKQYFHFVGAEYVKVTILGIDAPLIGSFDPTTVLIVQQEMRVRRFFVLGNNVQPTSFSKNTPAVGDDELLVSWLWPANAGNTHTQLEWTWLEDELETTFHVGGTLNYELLFRNNATRVDLPLGIISYKIPMLYGGIGKLYCRIRAVNLKKSGTRSDGPWTTPLSHTFSGHNNALNWQGRTFFSEEGVRKSAVVYYDGSLRGRQTVSKDNVTGTIIAAETMYDAVGRPAIQMMAAPISTTAIGYTPGLNLFKANAALNLPTKQLQTDDPVKYFDLQPIATPTSITPALDTANGAAKYYGISNPGIGTGANSHLPDAEGYPYTVTRYTPDGTGRVAVQSGLGAGMQMGKGHETKYYYGSTSQEELDGLFGTEVGNYTHYFKNMIKDANGQISINYVDMHGRIVATSLAGDAPANLQALDLNGNDYPNQAGSSITRNLLDNNNNVIRNNSLVESVNSLLVPATASYTFRYELNPQVLQLADCTPSPICYDCMYNLEISITDDAGDIPPIVKKFNNISLTPDDACNTAIGSFKNDTTNVASNVAQFTYLLAPGSYTIRKTLTIHESSLQAYKALYLTKGVCKTEQQLIDSVYNVLLTTSDCDDPPSGNTCLDCNTKLGTFNDYRNAYLASIGNPNPVPDEVTLEIQAGYNAAKLNCDRLCGTTAQTNASKRAQMLADMVPYSGQYAKETGSGTMYNKYDIFSAFTPGPQPFYKKPWDSSKGIDFYRNNAGVMDPFIHPTNDLTLLNNTSKETFVDMFANSWAEALLPHHPEYDKLAFAETNLTASYNWINTFNGTGDYATASGNGYIFTSSGNLTDPFYVLSPGYKADMVTKIASNYRNNLSLWQIAYGEAVCKTIVDPAQRTICYTSAPKTPPYNALTTDQRNQVWRLFRNLYSMERDNHVNAHIAASVSLPDAQTLVDQGYLLHFPITPNQMAQQFGNDWSWFPATPTTPPNVSNIPGGSTPAASYASRCSSYVEQWTRALSQCPQLAANQALINQITAAMVLVCQKGSDPFNAFGSSEVAPSTPSDGSPRSFEEVIDNILAQNGISRTNLCNPYVIEFPKPYGKGPRFTPEIINAIDSCHCKRFDLLKLAAHGAGKDTTSLSSFNEYLSAAYGETFTAVLFASLRQGCSVIKNTACYDTLVRVSIGCSDPVPCNCVPAPPSGGVCYVDCQQKICNAVNPYPLPTPQPLPDFLKCGFTGAAKCVTCAQLSALVTEFKSEFNSPYNAGPVFSGTDLTPVNIRDNILFAQFANFRTGFQFNWMEYAQAAAAASPVCNLANYASNGGADQSVICRSPKTMNDSTQVFVTEPPCQKVYNMAVSLAQQVYTIRKELVLANFEAEYRKKCLAAKDIEQFTVAFTSKEYHFTLYYYDMSGGLVKTVPPRGARPAFRSTFLDSVKTARANQAVLRPLHELVTHYRYNSLGNVVAQKMPDAGVVKFWYDRLGRLAVSQHAQQAEDGKYSYHIYDALGRVVETGQKPHTTVMTQTRSLNPVLLNSWINNTGGTKEQITFTVFDIAYAPLLATYMTQQNLRNRISYNATKNLDTDDLHYTATFFTYDIHGNIDTLVQDYKGIAEMDSSNNRFKLMTYDYDLISGKVNQLSYQPDKPDAFYHRYRYDAETRLVSVETSRDKIWWERDAAYTYYKHGPMSRVELGQLRVQGMDYAYTIEALVKGVNSSTVSNGAFDIGKDGFSSGINSNVARDVLGYAIHYFDAVDGANTWLDYTAVSGTSAFARPGAASNFVSMFNGNIGAISISNNALAKGTPATTNALPLFYKYRHDQLNRLVSLQTFKGLNTATNQWNAFSIDDYTERIVYDPNGNITAYNRKGAPELGQQTEMDALRYNYDAGTNQLNYIYDSVAPGNYPDDIDAQALGNYTYDRIGNLKTDQTAGITGNGISWNMYGKITSIAKGATTIAYTYDVAGNRITKSADGKISVYVRDPDGNIMSVYVKPAVGDLEQEELHLFGSGRLGMVTKKTVVVQTVALSGSYGTATINTLTRNEKNFELSNHLGNVLATIGDKKIQFSSNNTTVEYYTADVLTANDYYPFGMQMPGRKFPLSNSNYRYGFNGKEQDAEVKGFGVQYDYGFRVYDARIARFLSIDPLAQSYPWYTPYQFAGNKPIRFIDQDGEEEASSAEFAKALKMVSDFSGSTNKKSAWPGISKQAFVKQLMNTTLYKGYPVNQGHGWQCGVAAPTHLFVSRNPTKYVQEMIRLYTEGYFLKADGSKVTAAGYLTNITFDATTGEDDKQLGMKAVDFMLLTVIRDNLNDVLDFEGTPKEDIAGGTWPSEVDNIIEDYFGLKLNKFKYYTEELKGDLQEAQTAVNAGKGVIFFVAVPGLLKKDAKSQASERTAKWGVHYIVIKSMSMTYNADGSVNTITYKYWDYGAPEGTYKEKTMTLKEFQESTKGMYITTQ